MASEKKRTVSESEEDFDAVLVDIEGTTSSISFVKDELFPYVREFLKKHVDEKWETDEFKEDFAKLKEQAKQDEENKVEGFVSIKEETVEEAKESLIKNVLWQMDNDRKTGALKLLQGHMWRAAHKPLKGHVYDDVPPAFKEWTDRGKKIYVYSSGSVEAQKLLFGDAVHGDLTKYLSNYFDTKVGSKQEAESYMNILKEIKLEPSKVLFLTDIVKEAEAAKKAGLSTAVVIREGNAELTDEEKTLYKTIKSFSELSFSKSIKRQKLEEVEEEKKEVPAGEKKTADEPMDTSEDSKVVDEKKKDETTKNDSVVESKVEKTVEKAEQVSDSPVEKVNKSEDKTVDSEKSKETEKSEDTAPVETEKTEDTAPIVTKKVIEDKNEKETNVLQNDKSKVEEPNVEKSAEVDKKIEEEAEETKEVTENGKTEIDESENKENIQNKEEPATKKLESGVELAEEAKETLATEPNDKTEVESEKEVKSNSVKLHSNGVTEETKQNGDESIKVKKVDGAVDTEVVTPPVAVA